MSPQKIWSGWFGLAADLQVSPDTVKAWIGLLASVYEVYEVRPWFKNVANSIRKQPKIYFWDWSCIVQGGMRSENLVASHLLKAVQWWSDSGLGARLSLETSLMTRAKCVEPGW